MTSDFRWQWIQGGTSLRCYEITTFDGRRLAAQHFQLQKLASPEQERGVSEADALDRS